MPIYVFICFLPERNNNMNRITKAVITAGGLGTRMLPISHAVCKEMLPIVDRPAIAYLVEEAKKSGITDLLIILSRGKTEIHRYFDTAPEYEAALEKSGRLSEIEKIRREYEGINIFFLYQHECRGLGDAVRLAKPFTGDEPFAVLYGDDVIFSDTPVTLQLINAFEKTGRATAGVKRVSRDAISKYCSLKVGEAADGIYPVYDMNEKPMSDDEIFSDLAILGRVVLTPEIYERLDVTPLGYGGELQLTDAMKSLAREKGMCAIEFEGERFDLGSKSGFVKANIKKALSDPAIADEIALYVKEIMKI